MGGLRIIGGRWRSRKLTVVESQDLRPTPNRIRETLFNWLAPKLVDADCFDAFAGSGALGFEAASRGARQVTLCDEASVVIKQLEKNKTTLQASSVTIVKATLPQQLSTINGPFDIVFLDPPFKQPLIEPLCQALLTLNLLKDGALIYLESAMPLRDLVLPPVFYLRKEKKAGDVYYGLLDYHSEQIEQN